MNPKTYGINRLNTIIVLSLNKILIYSFYINKFIVKNFQTNIQNKYFRFKNLIV